MNSNIDKTIRETKRYWYEDGLSELGAAAVFAAIAGVFAVEALAREDSVLAISSAITLPVVVIAGTWLVGRVVLTAKERLTYPRSGFVAYRQPTRRHRTLGVVVAAIVAVAIALLVVTGFIVPNSMQWVPFFTASVIGLFFMFIGATVGLVRFYVLGVTSAMFGAAAAHVWPDPTEGSAAYFVMMAAGLAISGAATLYRYLRTNGPVNDAAASEAK